MPPGEISPKLAGGVAWQRQLIGELFSIIDFFFFIFNLWKTSGVLYERIRNMGKTSFSARFSHFYQRESIGDQSKGISDQHLK